MLNTWRLLLAGLVAAAALSASSPAFADTPAPMSSYKTVSPNGAYVFVMLGKAGYRSSDVTEWEGYTQSGLYHNDGSKEPLWTVDWYAYKVDIASDGVHLVRHGGLATDVYGEAIGFYANGELLRSYRIGDVVADEGGLYRSVTFLHWKLDGRYVQQLGEYTLRTNDGNVTVFDVTTGQIVTQLRPGVLG